MLNVNRIEQIYKVSESKFKNFKPVSDYIVEHYVDDLPGTPLSVGDRDVISMCSAIDMRIGAELVKRKYIVLGVVVGVVATIAVVKIIEHVKK